MFRHPLHRPSPALLVSAAALFLALGGTSYAALNLPSNSVGTKQLKGGAVTGAKISNGAVTGAKISNGAVTGAKLNLAGVTVPSAANANHANTADNASTADSATSAKTAGDADSLGGIAAAGYTRNDCNSTTGQIKGFAYVNPSSLTSSFSTLSVGYNCSLEAVQARRFGPGEYEVFFPDNPALIAVGNVINNGGCGGDPCPGTVSFTNIGGGDWKVQTTNSVDTDLDYVFDMIVP